MSWLSIPLPNPFKSPQSDDPQSPTTSPQQQRSPSQRGGSGSIKDDFSLLGQTIGRQLRGVATYLAPPPSSTAEELSGDDSSPSKEILSGIRDDLVEIGGSFKSGLSLLSSNRAVTEISRFASNLWQFQNDDKEEDDEDIDEGITEEVLQFVKEISMQPQCWTEFPLSLNNDFNMSDAQRGHASTIERFLPSVAALRLELCKYMSDEHFWMIYFVMLLPRLNDNAFKLLSSPEIVEARDILLQRLQSKRNTQVNADYSETSLEDTKASGTQTDNRSSVELSAEVVTAIEGEEIDEDIVEQFSEEKYVAHTFVRARKQLASDEEISFSDLEDDDNDISSGVSNMKPTQNMGNSSPNGSDEWVRLNHSSGIRGGLQKAGQTTSREKGSEGEESNDWLTVDDIDSDSVAAM